MKQLVRDKEESHILQELPEKVISQPGLKMIGYEPDITYLQFSSMKNRIVVLTSLREEYHEEIILTPPIQNSNKRLYISLILVFSVLVSHAKPEACLHFFFLLKLTWCSRKNIVFEVIQNCVQIPPIAFISWATRSNSFKHSVPLSCQKGKIGWGGWRILSTMYSEWENMETVCVWLQSF